MRAYILFPLLCLLSFGGFCQFIDQYGFYIQRNASFQEALAGDYGFGWGIIYTWGMGIYGVQSTIDGVDFKYRLAYTQKGSHDGLTINDELIYSHNNELDYLSIDVLIQKKWCDGFFRPYVAAGLSATALVRKDVADFMGGPNFGFNPYISTDGFNTLGLGGVYNLGVNLGKAFFLEGGLMMDFLPALKEPDVSIRNMLFSIGMGFHVSEVLP